MDGKSLDIKQTQLEKLKAAFPEAVSEERIDWEKIRLTLGEDIVIGGERYVLNWAGKSEAFKAIQTLTTATLKPQRDQSINFDATQNIFIEGENLEVLKVLQKSYYGKVKMIYIDPPYNTGNDSFIYPDKFSESKEEYLKRIGDKDEEGYLTKEGFFKKNSKENGQFHSNWLSMMYPRLFLARNLLREDGVIFISMDDNEVHNLRLVMNEVFGEENFIVQIIWKKRNGPPNDQTIGATHDYIIAYAKNAQRSLLYRKRRSEDQLKRYRNPDNHPKGPWTPGDLMANVKGGRYVKSLYFGIKNPHTGEVHYPSSNGNWRFNEERIQDLMRSNEIYFGEDGKGRPKLKRFLSDVGEGVTYSTIWDYLPFNNSATAEVGQLLGNMNIFDTPKPTGLLRELLSLAVAAHNGDIVFDFFAGSSTTAQAVLELNRQDGGNRKFILAQIAEVVEKESEASKAGHKTIADIGIERIRRAIAMMKEKSEQKSGLFEVQSIDLGFRVYKLEPSNLKVWRTDIIESEEDLKHQMDAFVDPVHARSEADNIAWEILLKSGYELTTKLERIETGGMPAYSIADGEVLLALEEINEEAVDAIVARKPKRVVCLDRLFVGNDQLKTNTALQMKDAGVEFVTI